MLEFINKNLLAILAIIVALIGGIPGILAVLKHFKSSPKMKISVSSYMLGKINFGDDEKQYTYIFLPLTVTNEGEKRFSPGGFDLFVKINQRWFKLNRMLIPEKLNFPNVQVSDPYKKDFQRFSGSILYGVPVIGFMMFKSDKISLYDLKSENPLILRVECIDIFDYKHKTVISLPSNNINENMAYPKHDMKVVNKPKT